MGTALKDLPAILEGIAGRRLLVIGDVMLDHYLWGDATRISPEAPVPVVHVARESHTAGGAANVAANVAALGASVEVVGAIGADISGDRLCQHLARARVGFDERFRTASVRTITKTRVVVRNQQLCRLDHEDPPAAYRAVLDLMGLGAIEEKVARSDGVIVSDYAKGVVTTELIRRVTGLARKHGKLVALDPKPANPVEFPDLDLVTPNRKEASELAGMVASSEADADLEKICAAIWERHRPRNLVVTLGADGMLVSRGGGVLRRIPTAARQVYDVSGAGDTVIAALALALSAGAELEEAAHFANAAAGVVVGKVGTAVVTPAELLALADP